MIYRSISWIRKIIRFMIQIFLSYILFIDLIAIIAINIYL